MINYTFSRYTKNLFCHDDIKNVAKRAMLFVGIEYRAGGEPVYRGTKINVKTTGKRFTRERRVAQTRARLKAARKVGGLYHIRHTFKSKLARHEVALRIGKPIAGKRIKAK